MNKKTEEGRQSADPRYREKRFPERKDERTGARVQGPVGHEERVGLCAAVGAVLTRPATLATAIVIRNDTSGLR